MKVILVAPYKPAYIEYKEFMPTVSLLYLAAVLRENGHEPILLDMNTYRPLEHDNPDYLCKEVIINKINEKSADLIGFSCLFSGHFPLAIKMAEDIRERFPDVKIVFGGIHPTIFSEEILQNCKCVDFVVIGEGETQIIALVNALEKGKIREIQKIGSFGYRDNHGKVVINPRINGYIKNLDELPLPAYDLLDLEKYFYDLSHWHNPKNLTFRMTMPILTSRSCPYKCSFCSMWLIMGSSIRVRSSKMVVDEIEVLYNKYGLNHFSFVDDNITLNKNHIIGICEEIKKRNLNIQFETPNGIYINSLDKEVIDAMVEAGWIRGALGIEHGSDYIRNEIIGKNIKREKIYEVAEYCRKHKQLFIKGLFIMGFPEDTYQTLMETYYMIEDLKLDKVFVCNLLPFPGTRIFEQAVRDNLFIKEIDIKNLWKERMVADDLNKFFIKPYKMEIGELFEFRKKLNKLIN